MKLRWGSKFIYFGGTSVPRGSYFSLRRLEFQLTKKPGEVLQGEEDEKYLWVHSLLVPFILPAIATVFMMFVPALGIFGGLHYLWQRIRGKHAVIFLLVWVGLVTPSYALTPAEIAQENAVCFECHDDSPIRFKLKNGELLIMRIDIKKYHNMDVHAFEVACNECHENYRKDFHPGIVLSPSIKAYRMSRYQLCQKCHEEQYANVADTIHAKLLREGNLKPPVCTDCHAVHRMASYKDSKKHVVETCRKCHEDIYEVYRKSVHGNALEEFDNPDVPTCIDCHSAHQMQNPHETTQHTHFPGRCGHCHGNKKLMDKYKLRTDVYETYLNDFHGVTVKFYEETGKVSKPRRIEATCPDCHGFHDIQHIKGLISQKRINQMCERCHDHISADFSYAWLSHYRPSIKKYPLVFMAKSFYLFFVPFTLLGLAIHLVFHHRRQSQDKKARKKKEQDHA